MAPDWLITTGNELQLFKQKKALKIFLTNHHLRRYKWDSKAAVTSHFTKCLPRSTNSRDTLRKIKVRFLILHHLTRSYTFVSLIGNVSKLFRDDFLILVFHKMFFFFAFQANGTFVALCGPYFAVLRSHSGS